MQAQRQGVAEKAKSKAKETAQAAKQNGIIADLYEAQQALERSGVSIPELLGTCFLVGITFGTAFQVTHNNGFLPVGACKRHPSVLCLCISRSTCA